MHNELITKNESNFLESGIGLIYVRVRTLWVRIECICAVVVRSEGTTEFNWKSNEFFHSTFLNCNSTFAFVPFRFLPIASAQHIGHCSTSWLSITGRIKTAKSTVDVDQDTAADPQIGFSIETWLEFRIIGYASVICHSSWNEFLLLSGFPLAKFRFFDICVVFFFFYFLSELLRSRY